MTSLETRPEKGPGTYCLHMGAIWCVHETTFQIIRYVSPFMVLLTCACGQGYQYNFSTGMYSLDVFNFLILKHEDNAILVYTVCRKPLFLVEENLLFVNVL